MLKKVSGPLIGLGFLAVGLLIYVSPALYEHHKENVARKAASPINFSEVITFGEGREIINGSIVHALWMADGSSDTAGTPSIRVYAIAKGNIDHPFVDLTATTSAGILARGYAEMPSTHKGGEFYLLSELAAANLVHDLKQKAEQRNK